MIYNACVSLCRIVTRNFLVASNYGRMYFLSIDDGELFPFCECCSYWQKIFHWSCLHFKTFTNCVTFRGYISPKPNHSHTGTSRRRSLDTIWLLFKMQVKGKKYLRKISITNFSNPISNLKMTRCRRQSFSLPFFLFLFVFKESQKLLFSFLTN